MDQTFATLQFIPLWNDHQTYLSPVKVNETSQLNGEAISLDLKFSYFEIKKNKEKTSESNTITQAK